MSGASKEEKEKKEQEEGFYHHQRKKPLQPPSPGLRAPKGRLQWMPSPLESRAEPWGEFRARRKALCGLETLCFPQREALGGTHRKKKGGGVQPGLQGCPGGAWLRGQ